MKRKNTPAFTETLDFLTTIHSIFYTGLTCYTRLYFNERCTLCRALTNDGTTDLYNLINRAASKS
jgi:hypothetical protein